MEFVITIRGLRPGNTTKRVPGRRQLPTMAAFAWGSLIVVLCVCALLSAANSRAAGYFGPEFRICHSFKAGRETIYVSAEHMPCRKAIRVEKEYWLAPESEKELVGANEYIGYVRLKRFPGWHCNSGAGAGGCHKGRADAAYNTFYPRTAGASFPARAPVRAALKHQTSVCPARNSFPDPSADIFSVGLSCARANRILGDFFAKAQAHGAPLTVDGFRCRALPGEIECRRRRSKIEYFGGM